MSLYRRFGSGFLIILLMVFCLLPGGACNENPFSVKRIGNILTYTDNSFLVSAPEEGLLTIRIHDNVSVYRIIEQHIPEGETTIHWDGCGYNQEKLYPKSYTITAELLSDSGNIYSASFLSPIEFTGQSLQYALPSSDCLYLDSAEEWFLEYRTVMKGKIIFEMMSRDRSGQQYLYSVQTQGGKIGKMDFASMAGKSMPEPGEYDVHVYETTKPEEAHTFILTVETDSPPRQPVSITGETMPDRTMSDEEIWNYMMKPSVVVDIDPFKHQEVYSEPDVNSSSLGTLHGQTQGLKVIRTDEEWALIGAWNHEEAEYVEGWVPLRKLKVAEPREDYGILIDKQKQTLSVYYRGKVIDTLLVSTGRAERKNLDQETSAGMFLTGLHRVNFSMNGKKYDYVIQYDGGNLLHQTPYDWGQYKKDFTYGRGYLGAKASHACIRIQAEPGEGGLNAYWLFTHIPYHTRVIILDDPEERKANTEKLKRTESDEPKPLSSQDGIEYDEDSAETVLLTFGGNLAPGGRKAFNSRKDSFSSFLAENGYDETFSALADYFTNDDMTCINLTFPIREQYDDSPSYAGMDYGTPGTGRLFRNSSIELVQLGGKNASAEDPGIILQTLQATEPFARTISAGQTRAFSLKGHVFGFAFCTEKDYLKKPSVIDEMIAELKDRQCERIIMLFNWGEDGSESHSVIQEAMANRSIRNGADLVVGSSPHSVQGIDFHEGVPVVYSLGDLLDGSTLKIPRVQQGILVQAAFDFSRDDRVPDIQVIPILPYGREEDGRNHYRPEKNLTRDESLSVIRALWKDTTDLAMNRIRFVIPGQS